MKQIDHLALVDVSLEIGGTTTTVGAISNIPRRRSTPNSRFPRSGCP